MFHLKKSPLPALCFFLCYTTHSVIYLIITTVVPRVDHKHGSTLPLSFYFFLCSSSSSTSSIFSSVNGRVFFDPGSARPEVLFINLLCLVCCTCVWIRAASVCTPLPCKSFAPHPQKTIFVFETASVQKQRKDGEAEGFYAQSSSVFNKFQIFFNI